MQNALSEWNFDVCQLAGDGMGPDGVLSLLTFFLLKVQIAPASIN